eukprot:GILI01003069.1.p1 GENE.GILI01003069.1~~GILI01003069.1.p1  ORF type:complete len:298 (+),score=67.84 GILI01003069.1:110-1003(+)
MEPFADLDTIQDFGLEFHKEFHGKERAVSFTGFDYPDVDAHAVPDDSDLVSFINAPTLPLMGFHADQFHHNQEGDDDDASSSDMLVPVSNEFNFKVEPSELDADSAFLVPLKTEPLFDGTYQSFDQQTLESSEHAEQQKYEETHLELPTIELEIPEEYQEDVTTTESGNDEYYSPSGSLDHCDSTPSSDCSSPSGHCPSSFDLSICIASCCLKAPSGKVGAYSPESRRRRVLRFWEKKKRRIWDKKISYDCRKRVADARLRIKGRFVTKEQAAVILNAVTDQPNLLGVPMLPPITFQ